MEHGSVKRGPVFLSIVGFLIFLEMASFQCVWFVRKWCTNLKISLQNCQYCYITGCLCPDCSVFVYQLLVQFCICAYYNGLFCLFFRQLVPLFTNKDVSLIMRGRFYSSCVRSSTLHGSETWRVRKGNEVALQWAEMRMVKWMCGIKIKDRFPSNELRERLGIEDIISAKQVVMVCAWLHMLQKEDHEWVKKYTKVDLERGCGKGLSSM